MSDLQLTAPRSEPELVVEHVSKRFGANLALNDVSFSLGKGEILALLGENGAGKSTMVKVLSGVYTPEQGEIRISGLEVHLRSPYEAAERGIGVVYQDLALFDNLNVAENLYAGREFMTPARLGGLGLLKVRQMETQARALLDSLEVRVPDLRLPVGLMSGGQRQAIAVAKAVAFATKIAILDEPTAALGLREAASVHRMIRRLPEHGTSVILITHNLQQAARICDFAAFMYLGKLIEFGAADQIFCAPHQPQTRDFVRGRFG